MKKKLLSCLASVLMISTFVFQANAATDLIVYTAVESEELEMFANAFEKENSDIEIQWVRDSTGIITAKLLAEGKNSKADIVWGVAATSLLLLDSKGLLEGYAPAGLNKIEKKYYDSANPPKWVGQRAWIASICVNTIEAKNNKLPLPKSWADLTKPVYKGFVVMPNPASSGTGFLDVSSWIQIMGDNNAWKFMDKLHKNIAVYTHSGSKPCKMAAAGEYPIGVSFAYKGADLINSKKAPLKVIVPTEGVGWDLESFGIMKSAKNKAAAKKFADWSVTRSAQKLYNKAFEVITMPGVANPVKNYPSAAKDKMIKNDFKWAANNRQEILKEWTKRYDGKSEKK